MLQINMLIILSRKEDAHCVLQAKSMEGCGGKIHRFAARTYIKRHLQFLLMREHFSSCDFL